MDRLEILFEKYRNNQCTPEELEELLGYFRSGQDEDRLKVLIDESLSQKVAEDQELQTAADEVYAKLLTQIKPEETTRKRRFASRWAVAASILIALSVGGYFLVHKKQPQQQIAQNKIHDIAPGRNQATLTLAGGQKIILTKGLSGKLAQQGNMLVQVNGANAITYTASGTGNVPVQYNTMATRRGEQSPYPLVLADGSKVWLNAASSITFPTAFNGNDREVTIKGEAYFEVAHNAAKPFRVTSDRQTVEVLGTHFDINSYNDESVIKTTLLEGKVKVTAAGNRSVVLSPGEQSILSAQNIRIEKADIDITMAWKDGMFRFDSTPLSNIMNQVSRWYDVDIIYQDDKLKDKTFFAMCTRFANVSQLLHNLEQTHEVKFKIEGRKITVEHP